MTAPVPSALKALRASLRTASEPVLRDRLLGAVAYLSRLYGVPAGLPEAEADQGDLRRRRQFAASRHRGPIGRSRDPNRRL